jgi:cytochrome c oxidase subunit 4
MGDSHSHDDIKKHVKVYVGVFLALLVGTIITVLVSFVDFGGAWKNISIALVIATVKAGLVAAFFMHLSAEKKTIYAILITTVFFFAGLMALTLLSFMDIPHLP